MNCTVHPFFLSDPQTAKRKYQYFRNMKNVCLFLLIMGCFTSTANTQKVEKFYDYQWKPCEAGSARFYSQMELKDSGWVRRDYYLPARTIQMVGLFKDSSGLVKNGTFFYFHPNKVLSSSGRYVNNKKDGIWISWHENALMKDSIEYDAGEEIGTALHWYNNGYVQDSIVHRPDGTAVAVSWFDNGEVSSAGRLNMLGAYIGKWQFFHKNGQLSSDEVYDNGKLVSRKYYSENGTPQPDTGAVSTPARFPGGVEKWTKFLDKNFYWPAHYQLVNGDKAIIRVEFTVDETGTVKDVYLSVPFEPAFNEIVIRTLRDSPKWIPAVSHNRKVAFVHRQQVGFVEHKD